MVGYIAGFDNRLYHDAYDDATTMLEQSDLDVATELVEGCNRSSVVVTVCLLLTFFCLFPFLDSFPLCSLVLISYSMPFSFYSPAILSHNPQRFTS